MSQTETARGDMFLERIRKLERRLDALDSARNINSTTIDEPGTFIFRNANGHQIMYVGTFPGTGQSGLQLLRDDGSMALNYSGLTDDPSVHEILELFDRSGNVLYGDDEVTGQGLSRPYLPIMFKATSQAYQIIPSPTTMTNAFDLFLFKQHPRVLVRLFAYCQTTGAAGQVDLYDGTTGTVVAGPTAIGDSPTNVDLVGSISGAHTEYKELTLRCRRTSGTGDVAVVMRAAIGLG